MIKFNASVAQLDRVLVYETKGQRFESFQAHQSFFKKSEESA